MKKYKNIAASIAAVTMLFAVVPNAQAETPFKDIKETYEFSESLENLYYQKIISGYRDIDRNVEIKPNLPVTRAQAAKMIALGAGHSHATQKVSAFADVPEKHWAHDYITLLEQKSIVSGKGGTYLPEEQLTRAQIAKMLVLTFDLPYSTTNTETGFSDVDSDSWEAPYIKALVDNGITTGAADGTFRPYDTVKRYQLAAFIDRIYEKQALSDDQALVIVRGALEKMSSIFYENVIKTNYGQPVFPYENFQNEIRDVITEKYEPEFIEKYHAQCRQCDVGQYGITGEFNLSYKVFENTGNRISIQVAEPANVLSGPVLGTITVVKENNRWKIDEFHQEYVVPSFNLTKEQAANLIETSSRFSDQYPVYGLQYAGTEGEIYTFKAYSSKGQVIKKINKNNGLIDLN